MLFLPKQTELFKGNMEKISTYLTLSKIGCPVFKSALIENTDEINEDIILRLRQYFATDEVTVRYQYIRPSKTPVQGGNRYKLALESLLSARLEDTALWLLEPINRLENEFGINIYFHDDSCSVEIVGKGFDVSDLNRGQISPHQKIITELPIRYGVYNEWWKFLDFTFTSQEAYDQSKLVRINKLSNMKYYVTENIFNKQYFPLPFDKLELLLHYISLISNYIKNKDFCVSCSISNNSFVFWDIQTPLGKAKIYGANV